MKKIVFTALAVAVFGMAGAQEIRFGVKGGAGISTFSGNVDDAEIKPSAHLGGFAEFRFKKFAIQPEILLSYIGAEWNENNNGFFYEGPVDHINYQANLLYLHVPVMAKYYVMDALSVEAGPQLGVLLSARTKYTATYWNGETFSESASVKDQLKTLDLGVNFGATYHFKNRMFVGGRYTLGLMNVDDSVPEPGEPSSNVKNQVFQAYVGYKF